MTPERWRHIEQLYHAARERPLDGRSSFLDDACAGDLALRRKVEALLAYDEPARDFIETPALEVVAKALAEDQAIMTEQPDSILGRQIGDYKILSQLGAGGMGEVYLAQDVRLDRRVAIKFLPARSIADDHARKRLIREAQAAAKLDHPNRQDVEAFCL